MRVFVAGATGVIGRRLVPRLVEAGHTVTAMTRSPDRAKAIVALGADPVECDVYDTTGLEEAVRKAEPDVVISWVRASFLLAMVLCGRRFLPSSLESPATNIKGRCRVSQVASEAPRALSGCSLVASYMRPCKAERSWSPRSAWQSCLSRAFVCCP